MQVLVMYVCTHTQGIYFTIDSVNGEIFTAGALDYNRRSIFDLLVTVSVSHAEGGATM